MNRDTLAAPVQFAIEVRRSRFQARATPIESESDVARFLREVHDASASHHCWAWRLGQAYRSSDDGEPGGSAGRPILAAIDAQGFDRVMVVVLRWFGGTKLGTGGLVRAYGGCAAECLRTAPRLALMRLRLGGQRACAAGRRRRDQARGSLRTGGPALAFAPSRRHGRGTGATIARPESRQRLPDPS